MFQPYDAHVWWRRAFATTLALLGLALVVLPIVVFPDGKLSEHMGDAFVMDAKLALWLLPVLVVELAMIHLTWDNVQTRALVRQRSSDTPTPDSSW